jgi:hypothetical protein
MERIDNLARKIIIPNDIKKIFQMDKIYLSDLFSKVKSCMRKLICQEEKKTRKLNQCMKSLHVI